MESNDHFDDTLSKINADIERVQQLIDSTSLIWIGVRDTDFRSLLDDANRANGALLGYLLRLRAEGEFLRDNPLPKSEPE